MPLPEDVVSALPEDYRSHDIVKQAADVASVVKMAIDGQRELGSRIRVPGPDADSAARTAFISDLQGKVPGLTLIPGEGATEDERAAFLKTLGRPDEAKHYSIDKLQLPEGLPEGFKIDQAQLDGFREFAHAQGYTQQQFEAALELDLKAAAGAYKAQAEASTERAAALESQFGAAKDAKMNAASRALEAMGGAEYAQQIMADADPATLAAWAKVGEQFGERGSLDLTGKGPQTQVLAPSEAARRKQEIWSNREHAYHRAQAPGHADAVFEMWNLNLQARGEKPMSRADYDAQFGRRGHGGRINSTDFQARGAEAG